MYRGWWILQRRSIRLLLLLNHRFFFKFFPLVNRGSAHNLTEKVANLELRKIDGWIVEIDTDAYVRTSGADEV